MSYGKGCATIIFVALFHGLCRPKGLRKFLDISVRTTICFKQNIHDYTPGYKRLEKAPLIKPQERKRESL
jgi:hypothetical protein